MKTTALGLIEVVGYLGAIEAADAALKAANVDLLKLEIVKGGLVTVMLKGDVGAIEAAVEAGTEAAKKCCTLISSHVIARLDEETNKLLCQPPKKEIPVEVKEKEPLKTGSGQIEEDSDVVIEKEDIPQSMENVEVGILQELDEPIVSSSETSIHVEDLERLKVEELRKLARTSHIKDVKPNDIKFGKKEFLVEVLSGHYREVDSE
jgi:microcompartment protein CcmL/EutN